MAQGAGIDRRTDHGSHLGACLNIPREPRWLCKGADARRAAPAVVDSTDKPRNAADAPCRAKPKGPDGFAFIRRCRLLIGFNPTSSAPPRLKANPFGRGHGECSDRLPNLTAGSPKYTLGIRLRRVVLELGVLAEERQLKVAGRAVALLRDDDVRDALARRVLVVYLFAIDQQNEVTVLFNCSTIMANNAVSQPTRRPWDRHVEDLFLTFETNGDDAVPEQIRI